MARASRRRIGVTSDYLHALGARYDCYGVCPQCERKFYPLLTRDARCTCSPAKVRDILFRRLQDVCEELRNA